MRLLMTRLQSDPAGMVLAALLLVALVLWLISRNLLTEYLFGLALGLSIGYNLRLVIEKRRRTSTEQVT